jgi:hypothetical protein
MIDSLCKDLLQQLKVKRFIETGTDKGETIAQVSQWFSELYPQFGEVRETVQTGARSYGLRNDPISYPVFSGSQPGHGQIHSVDADAYSYEKAKEQFKSNCNIFLHHSSSEALLTSLLSAEIAAGRSDNETMFFLDAHWGEYWPLRDEIKVIRQLKRYLIVIDDFMVPGKSNPSFPHGDFGFDVYKGRILNWAYIADLFEGIAVRVFYPVRPNRDQRGWVLITRGYSPEELKFLSSMDLVEVKQSDRIHTAPVFVTWRSYLDLKNVLKSIVPISVLRWGHRVYEKVRFGFSKTFNKNLQTKASHGRP